MEIIIVLVIVILIFGVGKLPDIGKSLGEGLRSFKKAQDEVNTEVKSIKSSVEDKPVEKENPASDAATKPPPPPLPPRSDEE
jgi:sec-independent protein translocase protein TatA